MRGGLAAILLMAAALPAAAQSAYRWVDADGRVHYSDQPPPQTIRQFDERKVQPNSGNAQPSFDTRRAAQHFPVTLYTGKECAKPCDDARALLQRRGVPFTETRLESEADVTAFKSRFGKAPFVPSLLVGKTLESGFADGPWNAALSEAGYPDKK